MVGKAGISEYAPYVNYVLCISDQENLRDRISQFSSHIALQYMMDVIFGCIYNLDRQKNIEYLQNAISFMDDRKLE
jgi:DNA-binding MurR/RpiR family transcriptional regulator